MENRRALIFSCLAKYTITIRETETMKNTLAITKALADGNRLRILIALQREPELCICQITEMLQLTMATVSRHISVLKNAGLVESRKDGRWVYCRIADSLNDSSFQPVLVWLTNSLEKDPILVKDSKLLKKIKKCSVEDICRRYRKA